MSTHNATYNFQYHMIYIFIVETAVVMDHNIKLLYYHL